MSRPVPPCDALHTGDCRSCSTTDECLIGDGATSSCSHVHDSQRCVAPCGIVGGGVPTRRCHRHHLDDMQRRCLQHTVVMIPLLRQILQMPPTSDAEIDEALAQIRTRSTHADVPRDDPDRAGTDRAWIQRLVAPMIMDDDAPLTTPHASWARALPFVTWVVGPVSNVTTATMTTATTMQEDERIRQNQRRDAVARLCRHGVEHEWSPSQLDDFLRRLDARLDTTRLREPDEQLLNDLVRHGRRHQWSVTERDAFRSEARQCAPTVMWGLRRGRGGGAVAGIRND